MSRHHHLGLDWGTSATKLVLRDYDAVGATHGLGYVLRDGSGGVRHPSLVVLEGSRLWFGDAAKHRLATARASWPSLKAEVALRGNAATEAAGGLLNRDLAVLYLAHVLSLARRAARTLPGGQEAELGFKLGVPTGEMNSWGHSTEYLRIARAAYYLACVEGIDPDGLALDKASGVLRGAWEDVARRQQRARLTGEVIEAWLRAEAASEMIWPLYSPAIQPGLYTAVDVGAGTTNACFFMIHAGPGEGVQDPKGALSFFGAACATPGLNDLLSVLLAGDANPGALEALRGQEDIVLKQTPQGARRVAPIVRDFKKVWSKARKQAYPCYDQMSKWNDLQLLTVGGGRKVEFVRRSLEMERPIPNIKRCRTVPELGVPSDLRELPARAGGVGVPFRADATFLLTAYGLSFETDDLPEITLPSGIPPFRPAGRVRQFVGHEEHGYDKA